MLIDESSDVTEDQNFSYLLFGMSVIITVFIATNLSAQCSKFPNSSVKIYLFGA